MGVSPTSPPSYQVPQDLTPPRSSDTCPIAGDSPARPLGPDATWHTQRTLVPSAEVSPARPLGPDATWHTQRTLVPSAGVSQARPLGPDATWQTLDTLQPLESPGPSRPNATWPTLDTCPNLPGAPRRELQLRRILHTCSRKRASDASSGSTNQRVLFQPKLLKKSIYLSNHRNLAGHISGPPGASDTTKIPRKDPQRVNKRKKNVAGEEKSAKFWASHPSGLPPFGPPTHSGLPPFGAPTPSWPPLLGSRPFRTPPPSVMADFGQSILVCDCCV